MAGTISELEHVSVVSNQSAVMAALVAAIHVFLSAAQTWMAGTEAGHDTERVFQHDRNML